MFPPLSSAIFCLWDICVNPWGLCRADFFLGGQPPSVQGCLGREVMTIDTMGPSDGGQKKPCPSSRQKGDAAPPTSQPALLANKALKIYIYRGLQQHPFCGVQKFRSSKTLFGDP